MREQIPQRDVIRHVGVGHAELRQVVDDVTIQLDLAFARQPKNIFQILTRAYRRRDNSKFARHQSYCRDTYRLWSHSYPGEHTTAPDRAQGRVVGCRARSCHHDDITSAPM